MWNRTLPVLAALSFLAPAQGAEKPTLQVLEQAIEAASADIRLPTRVPATLFARSCETCPQQSLQVSQATRFFLGKNAVTQSEFNLAVQRSAPMLGIFYDGKTSEITRLVAFGTYATATSPQNTREQ